MTPRNPHSSRRAINRRNLMQAGALAGAGLIIAVDPNGDPGVLDRLAGSVAADPGIASVAPTRTVWYPPCRAWYASRRKNHCSSPRPSYAGNSHGPSTRPSLPSPVSHATPTNCSPSDATKHPRRGDISNG